jgi:hypothetical protein
MKKILSITTAVTLALSASSGFANDVRLIQVQMKDSTFYPQTILVPVGKKVEIRIQNNEKEEVEVEVEKLNATVDIDAGKTDSLFLGPLRIGAYKIYDDNNPKAVGKILVK